MKMSVGKSSVTVDLIVLFCVCCSFWHLFVAITAHQACVLCAYYDSLSEDLGDYVPHLRVWPATRWEALAVPHVTIEPLKPSAPLEAV